MAEQAAAGSGIRQDQVQNAVAFLTHQKVRGSSMEERKKFLTKKGLTEEEINEAIRVAQPELDKQKAAEEASQPAPGMFATSGAPAQAPQAVAQAQPAAPISSVVPQPAQPNPGNTASWGKVLLASAAVVGLGSGLGLLAKKYIIPHLLRANQPAGEQEGEASQSLSVAPVVAADPTGVNAVLQKLDEMQDQMRQNSAALDAVSRRVTALEGRPTPAEIKSDVLSGCTSIMTNLSIHELKGEMSALRSQLLAQTRPAQPASDSAPPPTNRPAAPSPQPTSAAAGTAGGGPVPAGLPNTRLFRKLNGGAAQPPPAPATAAAPPTATSQPQLAAAPLPGQPPAAAPGNGAVGAPMPAQGGAVESTMSGFSDTAYGQAAPATDAWQTQLPGDPASDVPPYSTSFKEVLSFVQSGGIPPDVQTIDDTPKQPDAPPSSAPSRQRKKPWESNLSSRGPVNAEAGAVGAEDPAAAQGGWGPAAAAAAAGGAMGGMRTQIGGGGWRVDGVEGAMQSAAERFEGMAAAEEEQMAAEGGQGER